MCPLRPASFLSVRASKRNPKASPSGAGDDGFQAAGKAGKAQKGKGKKGTMDPSLLGFSVESSRIMQGEIQLPE